MEMMKAKIKVSKDRIVSSVKCCRKVRERLLSHLEVVIGLDSEQIQQISVF